MRTVIRSIAALAAVAVVAAGCGSGHATAASSSTTTIVAPKAAAAPVPLTELGVDPATLDRCDPIATHCMLPFPNDFLTVADASTPTTRRLHLSREALPANTDGVHIDPTDQNRADGWSPGSAVMAELAGVDLAASKAPAIDDLSASLRDDSPIVVLDATTGERHPFWAELDSKADAGEQPMLLLHPAKNFPDGHHIVIAMRRLVRADGTLIAPSAGFAAYRDGQRTTDDRFERRRPGMERVFADLATAHVGRADLQLAWDFTIASTQSLTGRMIAMRDDAFGKLGDKSPTFTVTKTTDDPDPRVKRRVDGTFEMPLYLTGTGEPGSTFQLDASGRPKRQAGTFTAAFRCNIPAAAATTPARMSTYGHGLLGDLGEVDSDMVLDMSVRGNIVYCATNWYGLAGEDVNNAIAALGDLSKFASVGDRLQQGMLAFLFLGRLMKHGFSENAAFQFGGKSVLKTDELYFDGNSQGAIVGGALTAVAQDFTRSVLGEAGMNYTLLLDRSVDFNEYLDGAFKPKYPKRFDRMIGVSVIQLLWDRGDADGYANHLTSDPLPGTPKHTILLLGAVGDHQVTEYSLRIEARTIGARVHTPVAAPGRTVDADPAWGLRPIDAYPFNGSAYFLWDTGSPSTPAPNRAADSGHDPHDDTPNIPAVQTLKDEFWHRDGAVPDVCQAKACSAPVPSQNAD